MAIFIKGDNMVDNKGKKEHSVEVEGINECPECGGTHISKDYDRGEFVCDDCGLVIGDKIIDQGPEWRAFDME